MAGETGTGDSMHAGKLADDASDRFRWLAYGRSR